MLKFCVEQWDKNKNLLRDDIEFDKEFYKYCYYKDLVSKIVEIIFNTDNEKKCDIENITCVDNGDYQGVQLFLIPRDCYQPTETEYLMTYVNYGSCSGCDTLLYAQSSDDTLVNDIMTLSLHIVQNTTKPYKGGWGYYNFENVEVDKDYGKN
jgi:hypothetical protein